jgi:formate dehydrogenase maturation protein FdhE
MFTDEQKQKYLKDPDHCPLCGSDNLSGEDIDASGLEAWRDIVCHGCGGHWHEVFTMTSVEDLEP